MRGGHCVRHWSSTQTTVALSSGEAELGGIAKGLSQGLGLRSIAEDLGLKLHLRLSTDVTAAIGMCRRLGVGKVRHLDTALLWVQEKVRNGEVEVTKIPGPENPGDALTKYLQAPDLRAHVARMNLVVEEGRASSAPQLTTMLQESLTATKVTLQNERAIVKAMRQQRQAAEQMACSMYCSYPYITCRQCGSMQQRSIDTCGVCESDLMQNRKPT